MTTLQSIRTRGCKTVHVERRILFGYQFGCYVTLCDRYLVVEVAEHTTDPPTCPRCIRMAKAMEGRP